MEEYEVISIPVSDGTERDFAIMDTFEFEGQGILHRKCRIWIPISV